MKVPMNSRESDILKWFRLYRFYVCIMKNGI